VVGLDGEQPVALADAAHVDRPAHRQVEPLLVLGEVAGHRVRGQDLAGALARDLLEREPGQVVDAVDRAQGQRRPPVLPRAARPEVVVEHGEVGAQAPQMVCRGQAGLPRPDHDDARLVLHGASLPAVAQRDAA
jgi:hypothetical protein